MNPFLLKELARVTLPSRPQGEGIGYMDANLDGTGEIFFPVASHRDPGHPLVNDVAIIGVEGSLANLVLTPYFKINVDPALSQANLEAAQFPTLTHNEELYPTRGGVLQSGWLQDLGYFDFNGDGILDLFLSGHGREWPSNGFDESSADEWGNLFVAYEEFSNFPGDDIRILFAGETPQTYKVTNDPQFFHQASVGDVDGDGDQDIVATNLGTYEDKWVKVYWNDGEGIFSEGDVLDGLSGVSTIELADFDKDGLSEIIFGSREFSSIQRFEYDMSSKTIKKVEDISIPGSSQGHFPDKMTVGDYDRDGDMDFLVKFVSSSSFGEEISTYLFKNTGESFLIVDYESQDQSSGGDGPELIDINNDGLTDIVYPGWTGNQGVDSIFNDIYLGRGGDQFIRLSDFLNQNQVSVDINLNPLRDARVWHWDVVTIQGKNLLTIQFYNTWKEYSDLVLADLSVPIGSAIADIFTYTGRDEVLIGSISMTDSLVVPGPRDSYKLSVVDSARDVLISSSERSGSSKLTSIERLLFDDKNCAFDLDGNAGNAARILATVFGGSTVSNPALVGIALSLFDQGMSLEQVSELALSYALGNSPFSEAVVRLLWGNVIGSEIDSESLAAYSGLIDSGQMSAAQLTAFAASTDVTAELVNLTGLAQTGLEYV